MKKVIPIKQIYKTYEKCEYLAHFQQNPLHGIEQWKIETNYNDLQRSRDILWTIESYNNGYENSMQ